jgi:hypothetical protein
VVNSVRTVVKYIMQPSRRLPCGNLGMEGDAGFPKVVVGQEVV